MHRLLLLNSPAFRNMKCTFIDGPRPDGVTVMTCVNRHWRRGLHSTFKWPPAVRLEVFVRQHTTTTNPETMQPKKYTRKSLRNKYVDLLEVTNVAANEKKSRVKHLKAKKLQDFIATTPSGGSIIDVDGKISMTPLQLHACEKQLIHEYPYLNLESMDPTTIAASLYDDKPFIFVGSEAPTMIRTPEEIENILTSFHNVCEMIESMRVDPEESVDTFSSPTEKVNVDVDVDVDEIPLESPEPFVLPDKSDYKGRRNKKATTTPKATENTKSKYKGKHLNEKQERLAKQFHMRVNLIAYLNVCVSIGMVNRGLVTLYMYRQRLKKSMSEPGHEVINIDLYNIVLRGYAHKGSFACFKNIFTLIEEDGLQFNEQTFAAIFECLGRMDESKENSAQLREFIKRAEAMGYTLSQIMDRTKFVGDQREKVLLGLRRIHHDFRPQYTPPDLGYNNPLLDHLNKDIAAIGGEQQQMDDVMTTASTTPPRYSKKWLKERSQEQLQIELNGEITIRSIENTKEFKNTQYYRAKLKELEEVWRQQISAAIVRDMDTIRAQIHYKPNGNISFYVYLRTLSTAQYVDILLKEIMRLAESSETYSPTVSQLYKELGRKVQLRYQIENTRRNGTLDKINAIYDLFCDRWQCQRNTDNTRQLWQRLLHEHRQHGPCLDTNDTPWPTNVLSGIGRFLYNILMRDIKIDAHTLRENVKPKQKNLLPAFYTLFRSHGRLTKEEVKPHPVLSKLLRSTQQQMLTFDSNLVPMLCPPRPWNTPYNGGYLLNRSSLIRLPHQAIQQWQRITAAKLQSIFPALDSLNQLASIPWRVNTKILDVMIEVFQRDGDDRLNVPRPPTALPPIKLPADPSDVLTNQQQAKLFKEKLLHRRKQAEMYSLWCDALYRLSLANHYRDKVFWLPHNMDFRGRVYPVPPHLNHMGSDLARALLVFDEGRRLGSDGFSWLKLHCINLTGFMKRHTVSERLLYAEQMLDEMIDSAERPLTGNMWWSTSEEPWQTLACCMEIANVQRCANADEYVSNFPIHQDGSCNGLQHYAALGRDQSGALSVNLMPTERPQDVYSAVASLVERMRSTDAMAGDRVACALNGFVQRKVIKQTVMTTVYGVTRYGARLQIARQLKDIANFPKEFIWPASTYLTARTFESIREMFSSTRAIQDWFTECARLISGARGQNVEWCTPLGLPVVQPYNRLAVMGVRVADVACMDMYERPNVMKQKNAFPPNFIHSLDSSHMMLTSLHCERANITFVSVHDCFWTHASTVPDLNKICREQFVALHSQPILEHLSQFLYKKFHADELSEDLTENQRKLNMQLNQTLQRSPTKGDFDIQNVIDSVYFFS